MLIAKCNKNAVHNFYISTVFTRSRNVRFLQKSLRIFQLQSAHCKIVAKNNDGALLKYFRSKEFDLGDLSELNQLKRIDLNY